MLTSKVGFKAKSDRHVRPRAGTDLVGALLWNDGRLLLGKRAHDRPSWPGVWDLVGGHVEAGETTERALAREVQEEVGVVVRRFETLASVLLRTARMAAGPFTSFW